MSHACDAIDFGFDSVETLIYLRETLVYAVEALVHLDFKPL